MPCTTILLYNLAEDKNQKRREDERKRERRKEGKRKERKRRIRENESVNKNGA